MKRWYVAIPTVIALVAGCRPAEHAFAPVARFAARQAAEEFESPQWSDWSAPVNLGPIVNSAGNDQHPAISRDGLSLYFASDRPGGMGVLDIYVSERATTEDPWGPPRNLGSPINSNSPDLAPDLSDDGHYLFFHSGRAGGCGGLDLYAAFRRDPHDNMGWEAPVNLGCEINGPFNDAGPALTHHDGDGTPTLYFTSTRPGGSGDFDIYKSKFVRDDADTDGGAGEFQQGHWGPATFVPELSGPFRDTRITIARDGLELFISSDVTGRPGGIGGQDVWRATRATDSDSWSAPVNLGPGVNSTAFDGAPALSWDGTTLYFFSARSGGLGGNDLYVTTRQRLRGGN